MSRSYDPATRRLMISAGHRIPVSCGHTAELVQHIAREDHVMSGDDTFECACGAKTSSRVVGPIAYSDRVVLSTTSP